MFIPINHRRKIPIHSDELYNPFGIKEGKHKAKALVVVVGALLITFLIKIIMFLSHWACQIPNSFIFLVYNEIVIS